MAGAAPQPPRGSNEPPPGTRTAARPSVRAGRPDGQELLYVVTVEHHDLVPGVDEVLDELLLGVVGGVDLDDAAQDGVRAEHQVGGGCRPDDVPGLVQALVDALVVR